MVLVDGQSWPSLYPRDDAVQIEYVAGYGAAASVPQVFKQAILLLVGHWYANRESSIVGTISEDAASSGEALLWPHRIVTFA